jgi:hypothetical protein
MPVQPDRDPDPVVIADPTPERIRAALAPQNIVADPNDPKLVDAGTPADVVVTRQPRRPVPIGDADLKIPVAKTPAADGYAPANRLVTIGDSLTHGFHHFAIYDTDVSYPALLAYELGCYNAFNRPRYENEHGGTPLNLEALARRLDRVSWLPPVLHFLGEAWEGFSFLAESAAVWNSPPLRPPQHDWIVHNLAVMGWDLTDTFARTAADYEASLKAELAEIELRLGVLAHIALARLVDPTAGSVVDRIWALFNHCQAYAALQVLNPSRLPGFANSTALDLAAQLGQQGTDGRADRNGIETLIVWLGANNALGSVINLKLDWTTDLTDKYRPIPTTATVWTPTHFATALKVVEAKVHDVKANNVIWLTIPHVTIAPIANGIGKPRDGSRYFEAYVRPWDNVEAGLLGKYTQLTANQCRAIDSTIDQYNWRIEDVVRTARRNGKNWLLLDMAGFLDVLAIRRYDHGRRQPALPNWWDRLQPLFQLPRHLRAQIGMTPTTEFFHVGKNGAVDRGGLFGLDGVHPTTIGYGAIAQRIIDVMQLHTDVVFKDHDGVTARTAPIDIDFKALAQIDSLFSDPPKSIEGVLRNLQRLDYVGLNQLMQHRLF